MRTWGSSFRIYQNAFVLPQERQIALHSTDVCSALNKANLGAHILSHNQCLSVPLLSWMGNISHAEPALWLCLHPFSLFNTLLSHLTSLFAITLRFPALVAFTYFFLLLLWISIYQHNQNYSISWYLFASLCWVCYFLLSAVTSSSGPVPPRLPHILLIRQSGEFRWPVCHWRTSEGVMINLPDWQVERWPSLIIHM